jgi:sugar lactone lactonase YvrE
MNIHGRSLNRRPVSIILNIQCRVLFPAIALCCLGVISALAQSIYEPYKFTTMAGLAETAGSADGTGSAARFDMPSGIAADATGNVYVGDLSNMIIRKITPGGVVTTFAGLAHQQGTTDGTGSAARFVEPAGVALDNAGNLYVADSSNCSIRKITPDGVVSTLAGLGGTAGSADGTGSAARFYQPLGVAVDSVGNVYVADTHNYTIRKITPAGVVSTLAGLARHDGYADGVGSDARFFLPFGVAVDNAGNVYVADTGTYTIRKITPGGVVTTLAGLAYNAGSADGTASEARFRSAFGVAVDNAGNVYVADGSIIRKITSSGVVSTLAGLYDNVGSADGTGSVARFSAPQAVAVNSAGNVYVADTYNDTIRAGGPKIVPGLSATTLKVNESSSPSANIADTVLRFSALQTGSPAGLAVRVQATQTPNSEASWKELPNATDGHMTYDASSNQFVLHTTEYPLQNGIYFRAISAAPFYPDSISNVVGPFNLATNQNHLGPTKLYITTNGLRCNLRFGVTETSIPSGIAVRIQATKTPASEGSWTDAPIGSAGHLIQDPDHPNEFYLCSDDYPSGEKVYFRAIANAPQNIDSISSVFGPYTFILDPAPTIALTISAPNGTAGSGTLGNPVVVSSRSFDVTATAQSGRPIDKLALQYDGDTLRTFNGASGQGNTVQYTTNIPGDHLIEAVASDDIGVIGDAPPLHLRVVPLAPGRMFTMINSGDWSSGANWQDSQGNSGVPGKNDFAIVGSKSASLSQSVTVNAVSLNGGAISGPGTLEVTGFLTFSAGQISADVNIDAGAVAELINDEDVGISGHIAVMGTWKNHGQGGITGIKNGTAARATAIARPANPNGFFDGLLGVFNNLGKWLFHRPAGGRAGSGSAHPPNPALAPEVPRVQLKAFGNAALVASGGGNLVGNSGGTLVGNSGGTAVSHGPSGIVSQGGGNVISTNGSNIVSQGGGNVISTNGSNIVSQGGGNLVATGGGNLVASGGGNIVSQGGGNINSSNIHALTADDSGFIQTGGELDLNSISITGPVILSGGVISGSGIIDGDLTNNGGFIMPGHSAGLMAITGNFIQGANGTLVVESGGPYPSQFDQIQIGGSAALDGKLELKTINGYTPDAADTFSPLGASSVSGSFTSVSSNAQVTVNASGLLTSIDPTKPNPTTGQPLNIATRLQIQGGDNVLVAGFIITGPAGSTKKVLIRGIGPSLANFGVAGTIADPLLELHEADGTVVTNDNWQQDANAGQIPAGFAPSSSLESAIYTDLGPGNYTAILKGAHNETGVALAEVYDFETTSAVKLANIATRGFVNTGDNVMIGGFIIGGTEPANVLVRAIGPSLTQFGVQGALQATTLELHDSNGSVIGNEGWRNTQESAIQATTIPPSDDNEAAILATLVPGNYTAVVRGKNDTTGIAVVEAYNLQ